MEKLGEEGGYALLAPELSFIDHSCWPNAHFHWDGDTSTLTLRALEDIPEGAWR